MVRPLIIGAPRFESYCSTDTEEVRSFYDDGYRAAVVIDEAPAGETFVFAATRVHLGRLEVTDHRRSAAMMLRSERDDIYAVCLAGVGRYTCEQRGVEVAATRTGAVIIRPDQGPVVVRAGAHSQQSSLLIKREVLGAHLGSLLDDEVPGTVPLGPFADLATSAGVGWLRLFRMFRRAAHDPDNTIYQPLVAEPLCQALLTGLLLICDHPYREALHRPPSPCRPRTISRAVEVMRAHPERPYTTVALAEIAGTSVRSLQEGFRRHVGMPPMAYLRQLRLARAHDDLYTGKAATVAQAAHRWGFTHLGRFAASYREKYGVPPSSTVQEAAR